MRRSSRTRAVRCRRRAAAQWPRRRATMPLKAASCTKEPAPCLCRSSPRPRPDATTQRRTVRQLQLLTQAKRQWDASAAGKQQRSGKQISRGRAEGTPFRPACRSMLTFFCVCCSTLLLLAASSVAAPAPASAPASTSASARSGLSLLFSVRQQHFPLPGDGAGTVRQSVLQPEQLHLHHQVSRRRCCSRGAEVFCY